ncbi:MAG: O-antigen ligase family protein [Chromatiaceae bacterium]|nr:O-antigen ligase family protein [Chromatiaceae bacterium]
MLGIYLFALAAAPSAAAANVGIVLFTLAFFWQGRSLCPLLTEPVVLLGLLFAAFVTIHSLFWYLHAPDSDYASMVLRSAGDWIKLLFFIPFAWWLSSRPQEIGRILFIAAVGLALGFLHKINWPVLDQGFLHRQFTAYLQPLAMGLYAGVAVLGLLTCRSPLLRRWRAGPRRWLAVFGYLTLVAVLVELLILSYSRTAWLCFAAGLILLALRYVFLSQREHALRNWQMGLLAGLVLFSLLVVNLDDLRDRMNAEVPVIEQIIEGQFSEDARGSIAVRLHGWQFALESWQQRPWFGWGAGTSHLLIPASGLPQLRVGNLWLAHFHNTYLELLFQFGAVGTLLFLLLLIALVVGAIRSRRATHLSSVRDGCACLYPLLLVAGVCTAAWVLADHRATNHDWRFFWMLLAGSAFALHLSASARAVGTAHGAHSATVAQRDSARPLPSDRVKARRAE